MTISLNWMYETLLTMESLLKERISDNADPGMHKHLTNTLEHLDDAMKSLSRAATRTEILEFGDASFPSCRH
jgi:hypothetical protein